MKNNQTILSWLIPYLGLVFFLTDCSSSLSSGYDFDHPLTKTTARSNSTQLQIQIPQGWLAAEDNEFKTTDIWLVKEDYTATIKFITVALDKETIKSFGDEELLKLAELNKVLIKTKIGNNFTGFTNEEQFGDNSKSFVAFQYLDEKGQPVRTVVFKYNSKFYETTAFALKSVNPSEIFKAQNSVLASIK